MFIELEVAYPTESKLLVNINSIKFIYPNANDRTCNTLIAFNDGERMMFTESYSEINTLIKNEVAAERGF